MLFFRSWFHCYVRFAFFNLRCITFGRETLGHVILKPLYHSLCHFGFFRTPLQSLWLETLIHFSIFFVFDFDVLCGGAFSVLSSTLIRRKVLRDGSPKSFTRKKCYFSDSPFIRLRNSLRAQVIQRAWTFFVFVPQELHVKVRDDGVISDLIFNVSRQRLQLRGNASSRFAGFD